MSGRKRRVGYTTSVKACHISLLTNSLNNVQFVTGYSALHVEYQGNFQLILPMILLIPPKYIKMFLILQPLLGDADVWLAGLR